MACSGSSAMCSPWGRALSVSTLISAGVVVLCVFQRSQYTQEIELHPRLFNRVGGLSEKSTEKTLTPLVNQTEAFALYLKPTKPKEVRTPRSNLKQTISAVRPAESKPKLTHVATFLVFHSPQHRTSSGLFRKTNSGHRVDRTRGS